MKVLLFLALALCSQAHFRLRCPTPRNANTGLKTGPCDVDTGNFSGPAITLAPGLNTISWEESVGHLGAPYRIVLSQENNDAEVCVLLDHIPHNEDSKPNINDPSTYVRYYVNVNIPDVKCDKCSIHMAFPMTDKILKGSYCTDPQGTNPCASVYHSCGNVVITGKLPIDQAVCAPQADWPQRNLPPNNYTQEPATGGWANGWLVGYPTDIITPVGPCAGK